MDALVGDPAHADLRLDHFDDQRAQTPEIPQTSLRRYEDHRRKDRGAPGQISVCRYHLRPGHDQHGGHRMSPVPPDGL